MDKIRVTGGPPLAGRVEISGAKNAHCRPWRPHCSLRRPSNSEKPSPRAGYIHRPTAFGGNGGGRLKSTPLARHGSGQLG